MLKKAMKFSLILAVGFCFFLRTAYSKELIFKWGMTEDAYSSSTQLNDRLEVSLLQENVRYKVEKALMALEIPYRLFVEAKLLPCQFSVFFYDKEDGKLDEFKDFLAKEPSCFLEEFDLVKERWIEWAQKESRLDEFSKFSIFLKKAEKIVREISEQKLFSILQKKKKDPGRSPVYSFFRSNGAPERYRQDGGARAGSCLASYAGEAGCGWWHSSNGAAPTAYTTADRLLGRVVRGGDCS